MRKIVCFLLAVLSVGIAQASPIDKGQAGKIAAAFLQTKGQVLNTAQTPFSAMHKAPGKAEQASYYVFNAQGNEGFVIVSGDDRTVQILGYADSGSFDEQNAPENMKAWLKGYADRIEALDRMGITQPYQPSMRKAPKAKVEPLLGYTKWNQDAPYNLQCPEYDPVNNPGQLSATGCVATATAQVMYYWKHPAQTTAEIPAYTTRSNGIKMEAVPANTSFDWSNMLPQYQDDEGTDMQKNAVARLMSCVGRAENMDYGPSSGAFSPAIRKALTTYFDYKNSTVRLVNRMEYPIDKWENLIYAEMAGRRPVIYTGSSTGGGHAFVVDGYDGNGSFHVNWGWGGYCDGYFVLDVLQPSGSGIGGSSTSDGYTIYQSATIGIVPSGNEYSTDYVIKATNQTLQVNGTDNDQLYVEWINNNDKEYTFDFGMGIMDNEGNVTRVWTYTTVALKAGYYIYPTITNIPILTEAGTYKVIPVSRLSGTEQWYTNDYPNRFYALITVDGSGNLTAAEVIHEDAAQLEVTNVILPGNKIVNRVQPVVATIRNSGGEYYGPIYFFANSYDYCSKNPDDADCIVSPTVKAGEEKDVEFSFKPLYKGKWYYWIVDGAGNEMAKGNVDITDFNNSEDLSQSTKWLNTATVKSTGQKVFMNGKVKAVFTIKNNDASKGYNDFVTVAVFTGTYDYITEKDVPANIPASGSQDIAVEFDGLMAGRKYMVLPYRKDKYNNSKQIGYPETAYPMQEGNIYAVYDNQGEEQQYVVEATNVIDNGVTFADMENLGSAAVTPNTNANTLYRIAKGQSVPASLEGKNVIVGNEAGKITIQDGSDFYTPMAFKATEIAYHRTFAKGTNGTGGWETIVLPFDVTKVKRTDNGKELKWFTGAGTKGDFWLKGLKNSSGSTVTFGHAGTFNANTPYIITVPSTKWGEEWNLVGKELVFYGNHASITASPEEGMKTASTAFNFIGTTHQKSGSNYYLLNDTGNSFELKTTATNRAFRAYFKSATDMTPAKLFIDDDNATTDVPDINGKENVNDGKRYNLNGQRVDRGYKGVVIENGKKVIAQ